MQHYEEPLVNDVEAIEDRPQGSDWNKSFWKFVICSLLGVILFIVPIKYNGKITILLGILTDALQAFLGEAVLYMALALVTISFIGALIVKVMQPDLSNRPALKKWFDINWLWMLARLLGFVFIWMLFLEVGPDWVINRNTGGVIYLDLVPVLLPLWVFAILLLPLLTDYGLMEYIGTLVKKPFAILFGLPGRSAIDAMSSWFGAASIGVLVTMQQYDKGYYSRREASIVATNFSVTSIAFTYVVAKTIGVDSYFVPFYLTIAVTGIITALIMPRIPPLSLKPDTYHEGKKLISESIPEHASTTQWALTKAVTRSHNMPSTVTVFKNSMINLFDIYFGLVPAVFAIGTIGLALTEFTPIFNWLSAPLVPLLELLRIPEAASAAPAMLVGFADMYLPALVGKSIESEMTRFVIGVASITQIIYMSEVGALILKSNFKLNMGELFVIFLLRTLIGLPIIALIAHMIF